MAEQNTGWRDISTAPYDEVVLFYTHDGNIVQDFMYDCGTKQMAGVYTHWQPLLPPPGEEVSREDLRKLVSFLAVRVEHLHEERDALKARCAELEAAAIDAITIREFGDDTVRIREAIRRALRSVVDGGE